MVHYIPFAVVPAFVPPPEPEAVCDILGAAGLCGVGAARCGVGSGRSIKLAGRAAGRGSSAVAIFTVGRCGVLGWVAMAGAVGNGKTFIGIAGAAGAVGATVDVIGALAAKSGAVNCGICVVIAGVGGVSHSATNSTMFSPADTSVIAGVPSEPDDI